MLVSVFVSRRCERTEQKTLKLFGARWTSRNANAKDAHAYAMGPEVGEMGGGRVMH